MLAIAGQPAAKTPRQEKQLKISLKKTGAAAIVIIGEQGDLCFRIQCCENIFAVLPNLQCGNCRPLEIAGLVWTPGSTAARTICAGMEAALKQSGYFLNPHWFCAPLPLILDLAGRQAARLHCRTWSHPQMVARLRAIEMAEAERFLPELDGGACGARWGGSSRE